MAEEEENKVDVDGIIADDDDEEDGPTPPMRGYEYCGASSVTVSPRGAGCAFGGGGVSGVTSDANVTPLVVCPPPPITPIVCVVGMPAMDPTVDRLSSSSSPPGMGLPNPPFTG